MMTIFCFCRDRPPQAQPQMQPLSAQQQQVALPFAERSFSHLDLTSQVRPCCQCMALLPVCTHDCSIPRDQYAQQACQVTASVRVVIGMWVVDFWARADQCHGSLYLCVHVHDGRHTSCAVFLQAEQDLVRSRSATLPPLQSVVELTSAAAPPARNATEMTAVSTAGAPVLHAPRQTGLCLATQSTV